MQNKKDKKTKGTRVLLPLVFFGLFIGCALILLFLTAAKGKKANSVNHETQTKETPWNTAEVTEIEMTKTNPVSRTVRINNISITGLSLEAAKSKILESYDWNIQLSYQDILEPVKNPLPEKLDALLNEIYAIEESQRQEQYQLDFGSLEENIRKQVTNITSKWNRSPVNAQLTGRNKETGSWIYGGGENGIKINQEKAVKDIMELIRKEEFTASIAVSAEEAAPTLTAKEAKEKYQVIGTFSTIAANNRNRNKNISLAMEALDGLVIFPGEEFSFNKTTGNRTRERGYMPAGAYRNGEFVEEPGGGVCQVSSTLYNAIIFSGIMTTERNPHSYEPSYVIPGEDAMVSYDGYSGPDLRFINRQDTSVAIRAVFEGNKLTISMIGIPVLSEGTEVYMRSEKTREYDPPAPHYVEDQTLEPGQEIVVKEGVKGTTWKTWLVTTKDGTVIEEEYFHSRTYRGKAGTVKRNTSGVVIPAQREEASQPTPEEETSVNETQPETQPEETLPPETLPEETAPAEEEAGGENAGEAPASEAPKPQMEESQIDEALQPSKESGPIGPGL